MIWVVAGEDEAGRESSLILHTWLLSPLATTLPFCCKRTVATRLTLDDPRTVSSERHIVAFVAFCVIGGGITYFGSWLPPTYIFDTYQMMGDFPLSMFK